MPRRSVFGFAVACLVIALAVGGGWTRAAAFQASPEASPVTGPEIIEVLLQDPGGQVLGAATFEQTEEGVTIVVLLDEGALEPGEHGIHVHEFGVCDPAGDQPFGSAGGHFNPTGAAHGAPQDESAHAGDLGNILAAPDGSGTFEITTDAFTLGAAPPTLADPDGSALVIHANPDDLTSQPSGESGGRVLCGVIFEGDGVAATPAASPVASPDASPAA